jgi:hypothetical protein
MKIERLKHGQDHELWRFFREHLPSSLRACKRSDGYGGVYEIEVKERSLASYVPFSRGIATVSDDTVELRHPEWFSDFEDICKRYEKLTKRKVTLKYWES